MRSLLISCWMCFICTSLAFAQSAEVSLSQSQAENQEVEKFSVHAQMTYINQMHNSFNSRYNGENSLLSRSEGSTGRSYSLSGTLFLGARLFEDTEVYYNPEMFSGSPFSGALVGLGGFQNGELQKGAYAPPIYFTGRTFVRQTFQFGGEREYLESDANQLARYIDSNRLVISVGKFNTLDFFDANTYSHDPRTQFQNFAIFSMGAYNYAADPKGFTVGVVAEWFKDDWTLRAARLALPKAPNTPDLDYSLSEHYGDQIELTRAYNLFDQPGAIRLLYFSANALMSRYQNAVQLGIQTNSTPDITKTRSPDQKLWGYGLNFEQAITKDVGVFGRWSWYTGQTETQTLDISQSLSGGVSINGTSWRRPEDTLGIGYAISGISASEIDYLQRGGMTAFIGDGALQYKREQVFEAYYSLKAYKGVFFTADFQRIQNPAYNNARGPINIFGLRAHIEL